MAETGSGQGGLWHDAARRLRGNRAALVAAAVLLLLLLAALLGPALSPYAIDQVDWSLSPLASPPNAANGHYFGTDSNGRDLFVRTLYGARVSLLVGIVATGVSLVIGVAYGAVAGYVGGRLDNLMMRFVDIMYALPFMFFVIILMVIFGRNIILIFVAIGAVEWLTMARIVRGQTLSLKRREFVEAARAGGVSTRRIVFRHIVPNLLGPVIIYVTLTIPQVILTESFLSFLGLGVQEPLTSLGTLVSEGKNAIEDKYWLLVYPGALLAVILFCLNFLGDGLRDALDPRDR